MDVTLRYARVDEQREIMELWRESAIAGFKPLLPQGTPFPTPTSTGSPVAADAPTVRRLVAENGGRLVATATYGATRDPDSPPAVGEVRTFFVRPSSWRRGVGTRLLAQVLRELGDFGYAEATLWSFAGNERANAFYERHGFRRDGSQRRNPVWGDILETRYRLALDPLG